MSSGWWDEVANDVRCTSCGSADVDVPVQGLPAGIIVTYSQFYEREMLSLSTPLFCLATNHAPRTEENAHSFDQALAAWCDPSEGRGVYPPGNRVFFTGCVIEDVSVVTETGKRLRVPFHTCRHCGHEWNLKTRLR